MRPGAACVDFWKKSGDYYLSCAKKYDKAPLYSDLAAFWQYACELRRMRLSFPQFTQGFPSFHQFASFQTAAGRFTEPDTL
jgi:hypothetical protein